MVHLRLGYIGEFETKKLKIYFKIESLGQYLENIFLDHTFLNIDYLFEEHNLYFVKML